MGNRLWALSRAPKRRSGEARGRVQPAEQIVEQIRKRFAGEKISDGLGSLADPDARPIRRGKLAKPNEFGYVVQLAELTAHTRRGARGLILQGWAVLTGNLDTVANFR